MTLRHAAPAMRAPNFSPETVGIPQIPERRRWPGGARHGRSLARARVGAAADPGGLGWAAAKARDHSPTAAVRSPAGAGRMPQSCSTRTGCPVRPAGSGSETRGFSCADTRCSCSCRRFPRTRLLGVHADSATRTARRWGVRGSTSSSRSLASAPLSLSIYRAPRRPHHRRSRLGGWHGGTVENGRARVLENGRVNG